MTVHEDTQMMMPWWVASTSKREVSGRCALAPGKDHQVLAGVLTVCLISLGNQGLGGFQLMK